MNTSVLQQLPYELITHMLSYLPTKNLLNPLLTNKLFILSLQRSDLHLKITAPEHRWASVQKLTNHKIENLTLKNNSIFKKFGKVVVYNKKLPTIRHCNDTVVIKNLENKPVQFVYAYNLVLIDCKNITFKRNKIENLVKFHGCKTVNFKCDGSINNMMIVDSSKIFAINNNINGLLHIYHSKLMYVKSCNEITITKDTDGELYINNKQYKLPEEEPSDHEYYYDELLD